MSRCDIHSLDLILRCIPNIHQFIFTLKVDHNISSFMMNLINENNWQEMLMTRVSYLKKFDFHISFITNGDGRDLNEILNSFKFCIKLYDQWQMGINRWNIGPNRHMAHINLRTLNYNQLTTHREEYLRTGIIYDSFDMQSTNVSNLNDYYFHSNQHKIGILAEKKTIRPVQHVKYLVFYVSSPKAAILSWLENICTWVKQSKLTLSFSFLPFYKDKDPQEYLNHILHLIDFSNVTTLKIPEYKDLSRMDIVKRILLMCSNMKILLISSSFLFSSNIFFNPELTQTFKRLNVLQIKGCSYYFPLKYASQLVQSFPSLNTIDIKVYSIDHTMSLVDILLNGLNKLEHILIRIKCNSLLDEQDLHMYVIEKRRQSLYLNKHNESKIAVKIKNHILHIWLS
ncbi:hypothetical protein I4U23_010767 [Adineta vaga]|nr:hypothetical protein I4U23_010767 [Adineta vaga]